MYLRISARGSRESIRRIDALFAETGESWVTRNIPLPEWTRCPEINEVILGRLSALKKLWLIPMDEDDFRPKSYAYTLLAEYFSDHSIKRMRFPPKNGSGRQGYLLSLLSAISGESNPEERVEFLPWLEELLRQNSNLPELTGIIAIQEGYTLERLIAENQELENESAWKRRNWGFLERPEERLRRVRLNPRNRKSTFIVLYEGIYRRDRSLSPPAIRRTLLEGLSCGVEFLYCQAGMENHFSAECYGIDEEESGMMELYPVPTLPWRSVFVRRNNQGLSRVTMD